MKTTPATPEVACANLGGRWTYHCPGAAVPELWLRAAEARSR